jgi:hypothetical protein
MGALDCVSVKWKERMRVDVNVSGYRAPVSRRARTVVRVRY